MDVDIFSKAMEFIALAEWSNRPDGGYTNDPIDPGGETKFGIAKNSHPKVDIKNLTYDQAKEIYKREYWDYYKIGSLSTPFNIVVFDSFVQHNPFKVLDWIKQSDKNIEAFIDIRRKYYMSLIQKNPRMKKYQKGWMNRLSNLQKFIKTIDQPSL